MTNLVTLYSDSTQISDLECLRGLTNLKNLVIAHTQVVNLEPLMGLKNLKNLIIENCPNITDDQVEELQKVLPNLNITRNRPNRGGQRGARRGQRDSTPEE